MPKNALPTFLNYNRSISPSEGIMFGTRGDVTFPVEVLTRGIRGTISNFSNVLTDETAATDDIAKELDPKKANLQEIQVAFLPNGADRLHLRFSVVVQSNALAPSGCNLVEFYKSAQKAAEAYAAIGGFNFLSERYAWNLINGRALWRNRFASEKSTKVTINDEAPLTFASDRMSLAAFDRSQMPDGFDKLAGAIASALAGDTPPLFLTVEISGRMPEGAEVFPSQEFIPDAKASKDKGKVLSSIDVSLPDGRRVRQATMHSQKIGNAIRVIDEWHGQLDEFGTTAIEAYGTVQSRTDAVRLGKNHVYTFLMDIDAVAEAIVSAASASDLPGDYHYLMAMLIRGGVFSGESKKKAEKAKKAK